MSSPTPTPVERIDLDALCAALHLDRGEHVELVDADINTGDYRVYHIGRERTDCDGLRLLVELHRQSSDLTHCLFELLELTLSTPDSQGICRIQQIESEAAITTSDLPALLPALTAIAEALHQQQRPQDWLLRPFMTRAANHLWSVPAKAGAL